MLTIVVSTTAMNDARHSTKSAGRLLREAAPDTLLGTRFFPPLASTALIVPAKRARIVPNNGGLRKGIVEPYRPTGRVLAVLEMLQSRRRITGAEIAGRLEVSTRTARRYVETLRELGVPVQGEQGRGGAYSLRPGFRLPPMMFTDEEALGLALGLLAARGLGLSGVSPAVEGALAKLERVMPEALRERVRTLEETVTTAAAWPAPRASGETVAVLAAAARDGRRVRVRYRSGLGEETEREVDTYAVVRGEGYWYAAVYDHLRGAMRLFRIDRVLDAQPLETAFERPPGYDAPERVLDALAAMPHDRWSVEVFLEATLREAREQVPALGIALEETPDGGVVLRSSTSDLDWMAGVLAGLRFPFAVRGPTELREALRRRAEEIAALAERT
jgi:predicted DNA-binding transcriptional regulator YafY